MTRLPRFHFIGFGILFAAAIFHATLSPRSTLWGPVLVHGDRKGNLVAVTFDDGPNEPYTSQILDILKKRGVKATFFLIGVNAWTYPDDVRRIAAEGHEIGSHTFSHPYMIKESGATMLSQIEEGNRAIEEVAGVTPRWFRPPHGFRDPRLFPKTRRMGLDVVEWSNMPRDWTRPGTDVIVKRTLKDLKPGDIILLHDGANTFHGGDRSETVAALPRILDAIAARGLRPVTLTQLVEAPGSKGYRNYVDDRLPADSSDESTAEPEGQ